jgi:hypothetical protein
MKDAIQRSLAYYPRPVMTEPVTPVETPTVEDVMIQRKPRKAVV